MEYEYIFGTNGNAETLRVKGPAHTGLTGFQEVAREYPDQTITDRFRVVRKLKSAEDQAGNCYDWYEIDRHYQVEDKSAQAAQANARTAANLDYLSMMAGIDLPDGEEGTGDG